MQLEPTLLAYLAGAIDADGHIIVARTLRKVGKRYQHHPIYYHPKIGFTSTNPIVPTLFRETFGGVIHEHQPRNPRHKRVYIWSITTAASGIVAALLIPYLRQKREQAEFVAGLCTLIAEQHAEQQRTQKPPYRITPEQLAEREVIWKAVTILNEPSNRRVHRLVLRRRDLEGEDR